MYTAIIILALVALAILLLILIRLLGITVEVVKEKERLVIYRLGRYQRLDGPGLVWRLGIVDKVLHRIDIRETPREIQIQPIFINNIPLGLKLNLWMAFDPIVATQADREMLATLFQMTDAERQRQLEIKIWEILAAKIGDVVKKDPAPENANFGRRILPVLPGTDSRQEILADLQAKLPQALAPLGYRISSGQNANIIGFTPPASVIKGLDRSRVIGQLREQMPDLSDDMMAQIIASIEGRPMVPTQRIIMEGNQKLDAQVEVEPNADGSATPRVVFTEPPKKEGGAPRSTPDRRSETQAPPATDPAPQPSATEKLSKSDLSVLKQIPRRKTG